MSKTIKTAIIGPVTLSLASDNSLTITGTESVTSTGTGVDGIDGAASTAWTITNKGTVSTTGNAAINLGGAGALDNSGVILAGSDAGGFQTAGAGTVTNTGTISGGNGVLLEGGGSVINHKGGVISGGLGSVILLAGGSVINQNGGVISGGEGVFFVEGTGTVTNKGMISGTGSQADGVLLIGGGKVTNQEGGSISANLIGVILESNGSVINQEGGSISGGLAGIRIALGAGTVTNQGTISGTAQSGVNLEAGGSVTNQKGGSISGVAGGVDISGGAGTVTNAGIITGGTNSVLFEGGTANNRLIINPGAVFNGSADATAATNSTIELTKGTGAISGIGNGNFVGFNTLDLDNGAQWTLSGTNNTIATVLNDGKSEVAGGLTVSTAVDPTSTGQFILDSGSTLEVAQALATATKMSFVTGSELVIDNYNSFGQNVGLYNYAGSLLTSFGGNGKVDLEGFSSTNIGSSFSLSSGVLQLQLTNGTQKATLDFQNSGLGRGGFQFASDLHGGVLITHC